MESSKKKCRSILRSLVSILSVVSLLNVTSTVSAYTALHSSEHKKLRDVSFADDLLDPYNEDGLLEPILQVRIPDTQGSLNVQNHFTSFFEQQNEELTLKYGNKKDRKTPYTNWTLEVDRFQNDTPIKKNVTFTNLVFTRNPPGAKPGSTGYLSLVAHYDSKIEPKGFIGAIDSAVPCAIMMYVAKVLDEKLTEYWNANYVEDGSGDSTAPISELGLQLIFLDGEEAFSQWTDQDSTYGARHLATKWEQKGVFHASSGNQNNAAVIEGEGGHGIAAPRRSKLEEIDVFVLLDLIGTKDTVIKSYYPNTDWLHSHLSELEGVYRNDPKSKRATSKTNKKRSNKMRSSYDPFFPRFEASSFHLSHFLADDHLPFLHRGVPILHLIPLPFPKVWHTIDDDADHLDKDSVRQFAHIMTAFVAEYMGMSGHLGVDLRNNDL